VYTKARNWTLSSLSIIQPSIWTFTRRILSLALSLLGAANLNVGLLELVNSVKRVWRSHSVGYCAYVHIELYNVYDVATL
jgi:hypothetical protein